jgi:antitoxin component YwqK of YwqJK toxin-antitoxin module
MVGKGMVIDQKKEGEWVIYNKNTKLTEIGSFTNNKRDGIWKLYTPSQVKLLELEYVDGHVNGKYKQYYSDGSIYISGNIES